jgi:hypothetical protein
LGLEQHNELKQQKQQNEIQTPERGELETVVVCGQHSFNSLAVRVAGIPILRGKKK